MTLSEAEIIKKVKNALVAFFQSDGSLLNVNANERSISHKLAEHLQNQFQNLHVDCEYNRHGNDIKRLKYIRNSSVRANSLTAKTVFPDIIVHERGNDENNLLVIEIKKSNSELSHDDDYKKLKAFTGRQFRYEHGLFLLFDAAIKCLSYVRYFESGEERNCDLWNILKELGNGG